MAYVELLLVLGAAVAFGIAAFRKNSLIGTGLLLLSLSTLLRLVGGE